MLREKVEKGLNICTSTEPCNGCPYLNERNCSLSMVADALALLKEQEELLRKLQKDKDKLCLEISGWKHKFHDAPPKFVSQGIVDQICWERDTALSQLEEIGKGLGSKMDDIVALLKEQEAVEPILVCEGWNKHHNNYVCPRCGYDVFYEQNYCSECGVRFLWEGR